VGGVAGLVGTWLLGERYGRREQREAKEGVHVDEIRSLRASSAHLEASSKFSRVLTHVNQEHHEAFREWLVN